MIGFLTPIFGLPISVIGLILSIIGRKSTQRRGMAIAGIVLSSIGLALILAYIVVVAAFVLTTQNTTP